MFIGPPPIAVAEPPVVYTSEMVVDCSPLAQMEYYVSLNCNNWLIDSKRLFYSLLFFLLLPCAMHVGGGRNTIIPCPNFFSRSSGDTNLRLDIDREIYLHKLDCSWPLSSLSISGDGNWLATACCDGSAVCVFSVDDMHNDVPSSDGQGSNDCLWWKIPPKPGVFLQSFAIFNPSRNESDYKLSLIDDVNTRRISWCFFCAGTSA